MKFSWGGRAVVPGSVVNAGLNDPLYKIVPSSSVGSGQLRESQLNRAMTRATSTDAVRES